MMLWGMPQYNINPLCMWLDFYKLLKSIYLWNQGHFVFLKSKIGKTNNFQVFKIQLKIHMLFFIHWCIRFKGKWVMCENMFTQK